MGTKGGTKITEKGDLVVGKIVMEQGLINLVPADVGIVHVHKNLVDTKIVHVHGSPVNVGTIHVHGNTQTGVQIPQRSDGPVTLPWML